MSSHTITVSAHHVRRALSHALAWGGPRDAEPATGPADLDLPLDPGSALAAPAPKAPGRDGAVRR